MKEKKTVRVFACGGAGTNVGFRLEKFRGLSEAGFASIDISYIDTSKSNMKKEIAEQHTYIIEGLDGSGKIRSENYQHIAASALDMLQKHKPADLNIVISSASGGSGSVISPVLTGELLSRESPTIVIAVGSSQTRIDAENTLKTLKSYEAVAKKHEVPVVMAYMENTKETPRSVVDAKIEDYVTSLCALFSGENDELDSQDLFNWLRYDRVTSFPVGLAALTINDASHEEYPQNVGEYITVATLVTEAGSEVIDGYDKPIDYQTVGFLPVEVADAVKKVAPVHFITSDGIFTDVASALNARLIEINEHQSARINKKGVLDAKDTATDLGLVL